MAASARSPNPTDKKYKPPLPPRPINSNNNLPTPNNNHYHGISPPNKPLPSPNYNNNNGSLNNPSFPSHHSLGISPFSSLPNSYGASRLTGPRIMPDPGSQNFNSYNPGGFVLGGKPTSPSFPHNSAPNGQNNYQPSTSPMKHMMMPMPSMYFPNTDPKKINGHNTPLPTPTPPTSQFSDSSLKPNLPIRHTSPLPTPLSSHSFNSDNSPISGSNSPLPSPPKNNIPAVAEVISSNLSNLPETKTEPEPEPKKETETSNKIEDIIPSKIAPLVIPIAKENDSSKDNVPTDASQNLPQSEPKLSTILPSKPTETVLSPISSEVKSPDASEFKYGDNSNKPGEVSFNQRPQFSKRPSRQGTGYSFSQLANRIPPSYGSDGKIIHSAPQSATTEVPVYTNSISEVMKKYNTEIPTHSPPEYQELTEGLELDAIDISKLCDQGLLLLGFAKKEFRFVQKFKKIEFLISHEIRSSSVFMADNKEEVTESLLGSLPSLLTNHLNFVKDLIDHFKEEAKGNKEGGYSKIFLRRIEGFAKFVSFAKNITQIQDYIDTAQKNSPKFKQWLQDLEKNSIFGEKSLIENFSDVKLQLNHYPSLLDEAKKDSPDTSGADQMVLDAVIYAFEDLVADLTTLRFLSPSQENSPELSEEDENSVINPEEMFWASAVPKHILESVDQNEIKRQEAIFEFIKSEREYAKDLNTIHKLFVDGIKKSSLLSSLQRDVVIHKLFFNYTDFMDLHLPMSKNLDKRQKENAVVEKIGDLLLSWSQNLDPYKIYGARAQFATEYCTKERIDNQKFAQFLKECEQDKATRRLPIDSFISMPTRRLARYPLHFKEIRKRTPDDHPDAAVLDSVLDNLSSHLSIINQTKGETDSKLRLRAISDRLEVLPYHKVEGSCLLELDHPNRYLVKEGYLKFVKGSVLIRAFLFDHCLLFSKEHELAEDLYEYQSFKKPIPLKYLTISGTVSAQTIQSHSSTGFFDSVFSSYSSNPPPSPEVCFSIANSNTNQLYILAATIQSEKEAWISTIANELDRVNKDA